MTGFPLLVDYLREIQEIRTTQSPRPYLSKSKMIGKCSLVRAIYRNGAYAPASQTTCVVEIKLSALRLGQMLDQCIDKYANLGRQAATAWIERVYVDRPMLILG